MTEVIEEFAKILESEREFALRADVDALSAIQGQKQTLLDRLIATGAPEHETAKLREKALSNVQLIRHLVVCLQGLCAPESPTYTSGGGRPSGAVSRSWGRL
jgi:flagellar biosynthesis/type III secretory pathway chaperone